MSKNIRDQFKGTNNGNNKSFSGASVHTSWSGVSRSKTLDPAARHSISQKGSLLRSSSGGSNLRRAKSMQKKPKDHQTALPDLSMEVTLLIVKRCVKEIRERGKRLTSKGILRQLKINHSQEIVMETIRIILDDDAITELSPLHRLDIHLVAHAMKWAIRSSEEILVTYEDYQSLYINQDRNFSSFVRDLPPTNRAILLDLFSLCADVTLLAHLNDMTLVTVAKSISLSIMDGPERERTTFDASFQQRNLWAAACEDLLRAFLRIKTTHDLAKIDQEDEVDENRYICNETRVLKSARQRSNEVVLPSHLDISVPSSAGLNQPGPTGWPAPGGPMSVSTPRNHMSNAIGYFDLTPQSGSPLSHADGMYGASLSRSQSIVKSSAPASGAMSPSLHNIDDITEYEELMQDQSHLRRLRQERNSLLLGSSETHSLRRRSVADMESLYMMSMDTTAHEDGYDSDPEVCHALEAEVDSHDTLIPDFADGLGWDFNRQVSTKPSELPSLDSFQARSTPGIKNGVNRSNSASSNTSGLGSSGPSFLGSPRTIRDLSKKQLATLRFNQLQDQRQTDFQPLNRALSQQDLPARDQSRLTSPPQGSVNSVASPGRALPNRAAKPSPTPSSPRRARRNSALRRSFTIDPNSIYGRSHKRLDSIHADLLARELALQADKYIHAELLHIPNADHQEPSRASSAFSLQLSPQDLERPSLYSRRPSLMSISELPRSTAGLSSNDRSLQKQSAATNSSRAFEVLSRPKDVEVSVVFTSIGSISVTSPKAKPKSKFLESFPERPVSPPPGYGNASSANGPKRTLTSASSKSVKSSTPLTASTLHQQHQNSNAQSSVSRAHPPFQQSSSFSGVSTITSQPSLIEGRSKSSGFIRALSSKLRPKQSDDQLRLVKVDNLAVETQGTISSVSFEPPRLELSFLDDSIGPTELSHGSDNEGKLPPVSAPALMLQAGSGTRTLKNWSLESQNILLIPSDMTGAGYQDIRPTGFTGARRSSTTVIGSNSNSQREQCRMPKTGPLQVTEPFKKNGMAPSSPKSGVTRQLRNGKRTISDNSTDDSGSAAEDSTDRTRESSESSIYKAGAAEREFRFSTATLLRDGKLYYQLQWEEFSELGFKSDFTEPEQPLSGVHQLRTSQEDPRKQSTSSTPSSMMSTTKQRQHNMHMMTSTSSSRSPSVDLLGREQGPSPAQRAAAMQVARESFMALANNPQALEAIKARSVNGDGQPTVISSGSFVRGSIQPILDQFPRPPVITSKSMPLQMQKQPYPSPTASLKSAQSLEMISVDGEGRDNLQRSMSDKSSPTSAATEAARLPGSKTTKQPGPVAVGGGGHGSFASLSSGPQSDRRLAPKTPESPEIKAKRTSRFFGKKAKAPKKSGMAATLPSSSNGGRKRRMLPVGVKRQDVMTKTVESMDEVFPWMCIEHMAGQESGWVMLEPVQDGAVGWVMIDKLDAEVTPNTRPQQQHYENLRGQQLQVA
ncbi:hypothetical protein BGX27_008321 [Mortierella sp. AM989]|nr:hypothetical protein BGX27_008321 [Mortierella sp. AM989]